jgi:hypothetical protein
VIHDSRALKIHKWPVLYQPLLLTDDHEAILRNLVAYQGSNASGDFTRYTVLMNGGIIGTDEDVKGLREKGFV